MTVLLAQAAPFEIVAKMLPFWPLLAAIAVGLTLALNRGRQIAHQFVVGGVALSAISAIFLLVELQPENADATALQHGNAHANLTSAPVDEHAAHEPQAGAALQAAPEAALEHAAADARPGIGGRVLTLYRWISLGNGQFIDLNFFLDPLTGVMLFVVTVVSTMVVIYAIGYMRDHHGHPERGYERFFAFIALFVFSMSMLVLAGNFVLLYLGWELVGLCSYLLIGFYYAKPEAAQAAKKAFLVNRIGDFGFALGIFALYMFISPHVRPGENPLDYTVVFEYVRAGVLSQGQITTVALLLMCGALGKSAQFPLYVWLPDAMEGPTPVSALIHAATMVTAGIYMIARCWPIYAQTPFARNVIVVLGLIGAFMAATMAMAQFDMKRILAYSTISQLAYMFVGLGVGAPDSAIFHLYTHAFFKALLFLTAGSVMHAMGGVIDLRHFSGLRSILPKTYVQMLVGCLALAGFPLLAGFWSKDEIVHASFAFHPAVGLVMLATAALTAYYTFRMFFLCFHGPTRLPVEAGDHPHDSPPVMIRPLWVLAIGAVFAGYAGVHLAASFGQSFLGFLAPHGALHHYLHASTLQYAAHGGGGVALMYVSALVSIGGIWLAWRRYGAAPVEDPDAKALGSTWSLWNAKYYVDELYDRLFVRPLRRLGDFFFATDRNGVDGAVWFVSWVPRGLGAVVRLTQLGALQAYALGMVIGLAVLMLLWTWFAPAAAG